MPPVKDEKPSAGPPNTSAQIQRIFSEVQLLLPSVNFDDNDDAGDGDDQANDVHDEVSVTRWEHSRLEPIFSFVDSRLASAGEHGRTLGVARNQPIECIPLRSTSRRSTSATA